MIIYIDDHTRTDEQNQEWVAVRFLDSQKRRTTVFVPKINIDHFELKLGQSYTISKSKHGYI